MPNPPVLQRKMLPFLLQVLNLMLKASRDPDGLIVFGQRLSRLFYGLRLKRQRVGGRTWPYLEGGKGRPVVLLHGFGADKDRFGSFLWMVRRRCHVVVPDIPGFGEQRQDWAACYDINSQVRRLERFIAAIGLVRFHLMGVSLGGYLAAYYAARNTDRVDSLCLMDSAGFSSPVSSDAWRLFRDTRRNIFLPTNGAELELLLAYLLHRPLILPDTLKRYWLDLALDLMPWRRKLFDDLLSGGIHLMDESAHHIKAPTLGVWGAEDRICHVSALDNIMSLIGDCRSYVLHGCGHLPLFEYPALSARLYKDFLQEVNRRIILH